MIFGFFGRLIFGGGTKSTQPPVDPPVDPPEETKPGGHQFLKEQARLRREHQEMLAREDEEIMAVIMAAMEFYQ